MAHWLSERLPLERISFSIPREWLEFGERPRRKDFPEHMVDEELCRALRRRMTTYSFEDENEYFEDLRTSRFGISTKRSGWDCLRHYELAASGCALCFRDLDKKPETCAPHGLTAETAIPYRNAEELLRRLEKMPEAEAEERSRNAKRWAGTKTTEVVARSFLDRLMRLA
jgi:hypothetical protein